VTPGGRRIRRARGKIQEALRLAVMYRKRGENGKTRGSDKSEGTGIPTRTEDRKGEQQSGNKNSSSRSSCLCVLWNGVGKA